MAETVMNLRGLKCPLPALRVRKMLTQLKPGDFIVAECTDPLTSIDIPNLLPDRRHPGKQKRIGRPAQLSHPKEITQLFNRD
jgi:tRNA 2-thiouridine synthesizing protein A